MLAKDIMSTPAITVDEDATLSEVAQMMVDRNFGCLPVVNADGELVGIITETDFFPKEKGVPFSEVRIRLLLGVMMGSMKHLEHTYEEVRSKKVSQAMTRNPVSTNENSTLEEIADLMLRHDIKHIPVVKGKRVVGIVTRHDLLRCLFQSPPKPH